MTQARVERLPPEPREARVFLAQARQWLRDSEVAGLSDTGRQSLAYNAVLSACDACLLGAGRRVVGSEGGHALRIRETVALLDLDRQLEDGLTSARELRAVSTYRAGIVFEGDAEETHDTATRLIRAAEEFLDR